jgi:hypothetical protein
VARTEIVIPEVLVTTEVTTGQQLANNSGVFEIELTSSEWDAKPGITVIVELQHSIDNGQTWPIFNGFTVTSPMRDTRNTRMPWIEGGFANVKGNRRFRLRAIVTAPIRLGAIIRYE